MTKKWTCPECGAGDYWQRTDPNTREIYCEYYSWNVVQYFPAEFDMIFIDGSHLFDDVLRDFHDWYSLLDDYGFMMFHDSAPREDGLFAGWPSVIAAVDLIVEHGHPVIERCDTIRVIAK